MKPPDDWGLSGKAQLHVAVASEQENGSSSFLSSVALSQPWPSFSHAEREAALCAGQCIILFQCKDEEVLHVAPLS